MNTLSPFAEAYDHDRKEYLKAANLISKKYKKQIIEIVSTEFKKHLSPSNKIKISNFKCSVYEDTGVDIKITISNQWKKCVTLKRMFLDPTHHHYEVKNNNLKKIISQINKKVNIFLDEKDIDGGSPLQVVLLDKKLKNKLTINQISDSSNFYSKEINQ